MLKVMDMKKKRIRSAIPIYGTAVLWLLLGFISPGMLLKLWFLILVAALSTGIYLLLSKLFPGREVEVRIAPKSGDKTVDALINEGRLRLDHLVRANAEIPDEKISANLDRMVAAGEGIFRVLERDTSQAQAVRKFMNYYLPTAEKLMESYRLMMKTENAGENIAKAMLSIENSLNMIAQAFEKQMDNLFRDRTLDIETDIDVLETMMASDGLIGKGSMHGEQQTAQAGN